MRVVTALWMLVLASCTAREAAGSGASPRVVSLHDVTTEIVVALDATHQLVGVAEPVDTTTEVASSLSRVQRVAGLESIVALRPDVVLGLDVIAEREPELVARLRERGIDVYLANPARVDDVYITVREVAARVGASAHGERLVGALRARMDVPSRRSRTRVFVYDCCDPPFTAGGKTVLTDVIARAGGHNVFAELGADWTNVSWEAVVAREPELVVIHSYKYQGQGDVDAKRAKLATIAPLAKLPTVVLPLGWSLGGIRSADALDRLREVMQ
jgi:iron complex transport system substrate-binding protein